MKKVMLRKFRQWHQRLITMAKKAALFITFEGGEGAGKTTLIQQVEKELIQRGFEVIKTREPGGSKLGNYIRQWLLDRDADITVGNQAELLLFLAARMQHIEELIKPALEQGKVVLCDRFNDSTIAYQGEARGLGFDRVKDLCEFVTSEVKPDLTFFLDVDPETGLSRTKKAHKENAKAGDVDRIEAEALDFHKKVQKGFHKLAQEDPRRFHILDANKSQPEVFKQMMQSLETIL